MLTNVLRSANDGGANQPDDGTDLNGGLASEDISYEAGDESAEPGAGRHGGSDTALHIGSGTAAELVVERGAIRTLIEVTEILLGANNG